MRESISNQVLAVLQIFKQNRDSLDLRTVTERSATAPSISDMLDWLQDAERHYQQQYPFSPSCMIVCVCRGVLFIYFYSSSSAKVFRFVRRKALMQTLRADDLSLLASFPQRWKSLEHPSSEEDITGEITDSDLL